MDDAFVDIDWQAIANELQLTTRGQERGAQNLPGQDETTYDAVARDILGPLFQPFICHRLVPESRQAT